MEFLKDFNFKNFFKLLPSDFLSPLNIIGAIIDIAIITYLIYKLITLVQETRAFSLLKGILFIILLSFISKLLNLRTISFLIDNIFAFAVLGIVIIFQPEIRRALEKLGTGGFKNLLGSYSKEKKIKITSMIEEVVKACVELSSKYVGALIIIEREIKIGEFTSTGTKIDSYTSSELLQNIFVPNTPLHDGAVLIREDKIIAASCYLPITDNPNLSKELGTRHRAALGITEVSDCIAIVVSEESGKISYSINGHLVRNLDDNGLRKVLVANLVKEENLKTTLKGKRSVKKVKK